MNSSIDIVIVNWNSGNQLFECVSSIEYVERKINIIVVDNGSTDESMILINGKFGVKSIQLESNMGFGKACNLGMQQAESDLILFLNPDTILYPGELEKVIAYIEDDSNKNVGICGLQLIDGTGHVTRSCARFPTPMSFINHAIGLDHIFPKFGHTMAEWAHDTTRDVDHLIGAFFLVRRELFDLLGGFDERFFVYLEDLDFSYRANLAGWRSVYLANAQAFHAGGGTSNQVKAKRLFYSLRSRLLYAFKHFHLLGALLVLMITLFIEPISRSALAVARRSWSSLTETRVGYGMLWRWLPLWIFKGMTR